MSLAWWHGAVHFCQALGMSYNAAVVVSVFSFLAVAWAVAELVGHLLKRVWPLVLVVAVGCLFLGCDGQPLTVPGDPVPKEEVAVPVCGPSPITVDQDCCAGCTDSLPCSKASGLAEAPCAFGGGWLVVDCAQCRWLP